MGKYNYYLTYFDIQIERRLDVTGRRRRRSRQLLDDLQGKRGY
jgi:hypothetical protein